jgi:hypothetical protein
MPLWQQEANVPLETIYSAGMSEADFGQFVDVDFPTVARRHQRLMGMNPRLENAGHAGIRLLGDTMEVIPESQWKDLIEHKNSSGGMVRPFIRYVHDQNGEPSCVSNAFAGAHEAKQVELFGAATMTVLAPISLYRRVGTPRSGSSLTSNMREMQSIGILPIDNDANRAKYPHTSPHNGYGKRPPSGWESTANLFRNGEWVDIESWAEMVTALLNGHPVIYARSGHCILAIGLSYRSGSLYLEYLNSWGDWGAALNEHFSYGVGFDSLRVAKSASYGAMALISIQTPYTTAA